MKITSVECYLGQFITMKINTDEGIYGWRSRFGIRQQL